MVVIYFYFLFIYTERNFINYGNSHCTYVRVFGAILKNVVENTGMEQVVS